MVLLGDGRVEAGQFVRVYAYVGGRVGVGVVGCVGVCGCVCV